MTVFPPYGRAFEADQGVAMERSRGWFINCSVVYLLSSITPIMSSSAILKVSVNAKLAAALAAQERRAQLEVELAAVDAEAVRLVEDAEQAEAE